MNGPKSGKAASRWHHCECCGKHILVSEMAARAFPADAPSLAWCFTCWDNNPQAVEQYRAAQC